MDKNYNEENLKDEITSKMIEYKKCMDDVIFDINEKKYQGEIKNNLKEAKSKTKNIISFLKKSKDKLSQKKDRKLVEDRLKDLCDELKSIEDMIKKSSKADHSFACPYCKKEINVNGGVQNKIMEIKCELCCKKFKCITGRVFVIRGKTNARVQYGLEHISITLKTKSGLYPVNFKTGFRFLITKGDKVSFIYLKKFLSDNYKENPSLLFNWDSFEVYRL
jgi:hypothetical protein